MWALFAPKWDKWRQQRLGLSPLLSHCLLPQSPLHSSSQSQSKKQRLTVPPTTDSEVQYTLQTTGSEHQNPPADATMLCYTPVLDTHPTAPPADSTGVEAETDAKDSMPSNATSPDTGLVPPTTDSKGVEAAPADTRPSNTTNSNAQSHSVVPDSKGAEEDVTAHIDRPSSQSDMFCDGGLPRPVPLLYGLSPHIIQQPGYWPDSVHMCGFWQQTLPHQVG